jgi:MFS family permease
MSEPAAPTVRRLGWLHFWNDFTLDFITPLLPAGVPVAWLGLMEGAADGVAQVLKLFTGRASDRSGKRAAWVATGYAGNAFFRPLAGVGVLLAWPAWIVVCRIGDRLGKGIRGSATDALVADWTPEAARATTYARMRTMDHLGATVGALAAAAAVALWQDQAQIGWLILALAVPAVAMLWLTRGLRDVEHITAKDAPPVGWWPADKPTRSAVAVVSLAGLGAKVGPLLILAHVAGVGDPATRWPLWLICLGWAALALVQAGASSVAGWGADKLGATGFLRFGWLVGAAVFAALALTSGPWLIAAGLAWGLLAGFTEGAEKTVIAAAAPKSERATAFGAMGLLTAITGLVGSAAVGFGLAWYGGVVFILPAAALVLSALVLARPHSAPQG